MKQLTGRKSRALSTRSYYVVAVLILLAAATVRLWALPTLPIGFSDLEIAHISVVREEIWTGNLRVFYPLMETDTGEIVGTEGLYHLVLAGVGLLFGEGTFGLRILSVYVNLLTVALLYTLGRRLFGALAGTFAAGSFAVLMWAVLLSRLVVVEAAVPLMVTAVMLSLARALPVYSRVRAETSNTVDFAAMGILISLSLYVHSSSLFVVLMAMGFVTYILITRRPLSLRRLSYIGFAILMLVIVSMPYVLSTFRLTELGANQRIVGDVGGVLRAVVNSTLGIFLQGDSNPAYNLPNRPLMDTVSGFIVLVGLVFCIQKWRDARYALVLIATIFLAPPAILAGGAPNFLAMSVVLPVLVLLFGLGAQHFIRLVPMRWQSGLTGVVLLGLVANLLWSADSLFTRWVALDDVQTIYHSDVGRIAHHFDLTADDIPVVICNPVWHNFRLASAPRHEIDLIRLHMNRDNVLMREVDCRNGFVFANAGRHQQVLVARPMLLSDLSPDVVDWLALGTPVPDTPPGMVFDLQVQSELEDALGVFITTSPASYPTDRDLIGRVPVAPPIRFGGNVTWLGYENAPDTVFAPDMVVPVSTYWRVEGTIPSDLVVFTHILVDAVSPAAQVDTIYANPRHLQERDVYLHDATVPLPRTIVDGNHVVSVGVYQESSGERLSVFVDNRETEGDRIFLYPITVEMPVDTEN